MKLRTFALLTMLAFVTAARAEEALSVAVFDFESKEEGVRELGPKVSAMINATLSADPRFITVERAELDKMLGEMDLGMSGTVNADTAAKVGYLTGAKVLVTGRVFKLERDTIMVAKVIGTETGRVYGEMVRGGGSAADLSAELAQKIAATTIKQAATLEAKVQKPEERIKFIRKLLKETKLPTVCIHIPERHSGGITIDPAAETELGLILQQCGFTLLDNKTGRKADLEINGEALSEFGMRRGNLVSCKGRVELKVTDTATGKLLVVDRQTCVAVDLSEQIAAKTALQKAAQELASRVIPQVVK